MLGEIDRAGHCAWRSAAGGPGRFDDSFRFPVCGKMCERAHTAMQDPKSLEELTGLAAMHAAAELVDLDFDDSDDEGEAGAPDIDEWTSL